MSCLQILVQVIHRRGDVPGIDVPGRPWTSRGRPGDVLGTSPGGVPGTSLGRPGDVPGNVPGTSPGRPRDIPGTSWGRPWDVPGTSLGRVGPFSPQTRFSPDPFLPFGRILAWIQDPESYVQYWECQWSLADIINRRQSRSPSIDISH